MSTRKTATARFVSLFAAVAAAGPLLAGCAAPGASGGTASGDDALSIAYGSPGDSAAQFKPITDQFVSSADDLGWAMATYDNNFDAAAALGNAKLMAGSAADVIIDFTSVDGIQSAVSEVFAEAGKPCIAVNFAIDGCPLLNIDNALYGTEGGQNLASSAEAAGWTADDTTFIAVGAATGGSLTLNAVSHAIEAFSQEFGGMAPIDAAEVTADATEIGDNVIQVDGNGLLADSTTAVRDALQNIPPGRHLAFMAINDDVALGVLAALDSAGRTHDSLVASIGSSSAGLENLRTNPVWVSEGGVYFNYWAGYSLAMARAIVDGQDLPELTIAPQNTLTKDTVDEYFDGDTPIAAPAPSESATYLLETGVLQELGMVAP